MNKQASPNKLFENTIRKAGDPVLRQICEPVDLATDSLVFLVDLRVVCEKYRNGTEIAAGLAAPQVGVAKRAIVTGVDRDSRGQVRVRTFINPVITARSAETSLAAEGCLSYPGVTKVIRRHVSIELAWLNLKGVPQAARFEGFHARVIQHEVDHLDGVCRVGDDSPADGELPAVTTPKPAPLAGVIALAALTGLGARR